MHLVDMSISHLHMYTRPLSRRCSHCLVRMGQARGTIGSRPVALWGLGLLLGRKS